MKKDTLGRWGLVILGLLMAVLLTYFSLVPKILFIVSFLATWSARSYLFALLLILTKDNRDLSWFKIETSVLIFYGVVVFVAGLIDKKLNWLATILVGAGVANLLVRHIIVNKMKRSNQQAS